MREYDDSRKNLKAMLLFCKVNLVRLAFVGHSGGWAATAVLLSEGSSFYLLLLLFFRDLPWHLLYKYLSTLNAVLGTSEDWTA